MYGIHHSSVKCVNLLLEILCPMHLIRLVVHVCILGSRAAKRSETSTSNASLPAPHATTQAESRLTSLQTALGVYTTRSTLDFESGLTSLTALEVPLDLYLITAPCI